MTELATLFDERAARAAMLVPPTLKTALLAYYEVLTRWNRKINLTALSDPAAAIDRLLLEPVSAAEHLPREVPMADLGSGGGSPAIPLALALQAPSLLMVESRSRKAAFLREAAREVGIRSTVEPVRFEELMAQPRHLNSVDLVTMRAVTPDKTVLQLAQRLSRTGAVVAVFASQDDVTAIPSGFSKGSTWNIRPSGMLITFHVGHN